MALQSSDAMAMYEYKIIIVIIVFPRTCNTVDYSH